MAKCPGKNGLGACSRTALQVTKGNNYCKFQNQVGIMDLRLLARSTEISNGSE